MNLILASGALDLGDPLVMGVLNVTPDSFSDGGRYARLDQAVARAMELQQEGAALIDVGGESTRPGSLPVNSQEEISRVIPVVSELVAAGSVPVSVDTSKPEVMQAAIDAGAALINDVNALRAPGALETVADSETSVCLMHMRGAPRDMQKDPRYDDVVVEVCRFLDERINACVDAGIGPERIVIDPGFGFGKTLQHNLALLANLDRLCAMGQPVLAGLSRKSMLGQLLDREVDQRLPGSLALAALAVTRGASIIRAHDVAATVDAVRVAAAVKAAGE